MNLFVLDEELSQQLESAETYTVDPGSESREAKIAEVLTGEPRPVKGYAYTIDELDGKVPNEQLFAWAARMIELAPDAVDGYLVRLEVANRTGISDWLASDMERLTPICPEDELLQCAQACFRMRDFRRAKSFLDRLLNQVPDDDLFLSFRGFAAFELGQLDEAAADLLKSIELNSEDNVRKSFDHATLARICHRSSQLAEARAHADRAIELDPLSRHGYVAAVQVADAQGDHARALELLGEALKVAPEHEEVLELRAKLERK